MKRFILRLPWPLHWPLDLPVIGGLSPPAGTAHGFACALILISMTRDRAVYLRRGGHIKSRSEARDASWKGSSARVPPWAASQAATFVLL